MTNLTTAAVALGSNLGDRREHLFWAASRLALLLQNFRMSTVVETDAVDVPDVQPPYLNAVAVGRTSLSARALLDSLLELEHERQRTRSGWRTARTLDLDLILFGDEVIEEDGLTVPHPRFRQRRFVLEPLVQVAPDLRDPVTGFTAAVLWQHLAGGEDADRAR